MLQCFNMKVGLDISQIAYPGGVATYTRNLSRSLQNQNDIDMSFFYSSLRRAYQGDLKNVKQYKYPISLLEILFNRIRLLPIESFMGNLDVFHSSDWTQPPTKAKKVTTYHDVVALKYPQWSIPKIVSVHKRRLAIVEKEIDMVIAVSKSTKQDLLEISKIPEEKVVVIYEGVDKIFYPQSEDKVQKFRAKYNLPNEFILAIGGVGERRNLKRVKQAADGHQLLITGENIPWIPESELPLLYSSAKLLLYPSLYEGFGLPILEAMACGTPVITSSISSMPEVAGDAALLVDPLNERDIEKKLEILLKDNILREDYIKKGLTRAKKFSWEKCAEQTAKVYKSLGI